MSRYRIKSINKTNPPDGAISNCWYQYIIENDINTITSLSAGSEKEIRKVAAATVKRLNEKYLTNYKVKYNNPVYENSLSSYS